MESVLSRYPDLASELRPILKASINARMRSMAVSGPSLEVARRGRAKLLQRASEMREAKFAPRKRVIPFFQRLAISFTLTALFLASGTGLVGASSSALPGENLYPVKLTWENLRLFFTFDHEAHELLEHAFENERLHEINELLAEGRHETIQFTGVYTEANGQTYVSGVRIVILDTTVLPADKLLNGAAVIVTGHTNAEGFVDVESIELLPAGTIVPVGPPLQVEMQKNENGNDDGNTNEHGNDNGGVNSNENENGNDNSNDNGNSNDNVNDNSNNNGNGNDNSGDDGNDNGDDDGSDTGDNNGNDNGNDNENANENSNDNVNEDANENGNDNVNENVNDNVNENSNDISNDNSDDNSDDDSNDNSNDNSDDNNNNNNSNNSNDNDNNDSGDG